MLPDEHFEWECLESVAMNVEHHLWLPWKAYKHHLKNYFNLPLDWNHQFIPEMCQNVVYFYNDKMIGIAMFN